MPRRKLVMRVAVAALLLLGVSALLAGALSWLGTAARPAAEETVAAWLRAAQIGDVQRMLELTAPARRENMAEHRVLIQRLVHDTRPANADEAASNPAAFTFEVHGDRTRYSDDGTASVVAELSRHGTTVMREYRLVHDQGRWFIESWRNLTSP